METTVRPSRPGALQMSGPGNQDQPQFHNRPGPHGPRGPHSPQAHPNHQPYRGPEPQRSQTFRLHPNAPQPGPQPHHPHPGAQQVPAPFHGSSPVPHSAHPPQHGGAYHGAPHHGMHPMPVASQHQPPMAVPAAQGLQDETSKAIVHEDKNISTYIGYAKLVLLLLVVGLGGWATFSKISGAVVASGKVVVEANVKSVQHLEGGIVRQLSVRDGQKVQKGDVLITLDKTRVEGQITGLISQAKAKKQQLVLLESELEDLRALAEKGLVPRNRVARHERDLAELTGEHGRLQSDIDRLSSDKSRLEVKAPISGRVHKLAVHTLGGVVAPGQEILQLVPSDAKLILEAQVNPTDIDQVQDGQPVRVILSSFNQRTTPELNGTVIQVSPELVQDEQSRGFFYMVRVGLSQNELQRLDGKELVPGMPAEIFIQTQDRTVMSYLVRPFTDQLNRALREE